VRARILLSACVGIATVVAGVPVVIIVGLTIATQILQRNQPAGTRAEIGWDLIGLAHDYPVISILIPLALFAGGFFFAFRHLSRTLIQK